MSFPDFGPFQIASVTYLTSLTSLTAPSGHGSVGGGPISFSFSFVSAPGAVPDYSWFSQALTETAIGTALDLIAAALAPLIGLPVATVQAGITVVRQFTLQVPQAASYTLGAADSPPVTAYQPMAYPVS